MLSPLPDCAPAWGPPFQPLAPNPETCSLALPSSSDSACSGPIRVPLHGTFELTVRCNLYCKMCLFRRQDSENRALLANELTVGQWIELARQAAEAGTLDLLITGGEPLLREDFCEVWESIYRLGFVITLYTNATLVTPRVMETLRKYPPHRIGVTIYGAGPETYGRVTGSAGAFAKVMEGIRLLRTLPSHIEYRMTVIRDNYDDVAAVEELIRREFDAESRLITTRLVTKAVRGGCADVESCRLPAEKNIELTIERSVREMRSLLGDRFERGRVAITRREMDKKSATRCDDAGAESSALQADAKQHLQLSSDTPAKPTLFGCDAGMTSYTVTWDGHLQGCQMMNAFAVKIGGCFRRAWKAFPKGVSLPPLCEKCRKCSLQEYCMLCPAFRYAETGTFSEAPDYICRDVAARVKLLEEAEVVGRCHLQEDRSDSKENRSSASIGFAEKPEHCVH